jgi:hypothetical protein
MVELTALAATIVGKFLVPFASHGADGLATKLVGGAAESAGKITKQVWEKVKGVFAGDPEREATFATFERHPEKAADIITDELVEILKANPSLKNELAELVGSGEGVNAVKVLDNSGVSIVLQHSSVSGTVIGIQNQRAPDRDDSQAGQSQE